MNIKTRFAPSPTGNLHIGNIRTALFAWLFARKQGGKFLLRIEDTNFESDIGSNAIKNIIFVLKWLGLDWDEGPYFQTDRLNRYNNIIDDMLKSKIAYKCYCSPERLELLRKTQIKNREKPKYDGYCRLKFTNDSVIENVPYVVRFVNPIVGEVIFHDQIRGVIAFNNQELDDLIIRRSNGIPTYNFCVVIDDMDMNITHVIRGEEHINNTPRQINILKKLNASIPIYAHVPMILDSDRKKLSKRSGTAGIMKYYDDGFLPEAVLNYLVRMGWSHGNQEIFTIEQMIQCFNLNAVSKSSCVFNFKKLLWINNYYINNLPRDYIIKYLSKYMDVKGIDYKNGPKLVNVVNLFSKRCNTLQEIVHNCLYLYQDFDVFEKQMAKKYLKPIIMTPLKLLKEKLSNIKNWTSDSIKIVILETINELNIDMRVIGMPLRVALTGTDRSPDISIIAYMIGKYRVLQRIEQAISYMNKILLNSL